MLCFQHESSSIILLPEVVLKIFSFKKWPKPIWISAHDVIIIGDYVILSQIIRTIKYQRTLLNYYFINIYSFFIKSWKKFVNAPGLRSSRYSIFRGYTL